MAGPSLYLGRIGSTGTSTAPHAHWEVMKDGKRFPLSQARSDIGQYLQFRLPNQESWQSLYSKQGNDFVLNPAATLTSPMGMRKHPVHGDMREHMGEDYGGFPEGTQLRFLGQGSVATHANRGGAGNVSSLRTGPYELQTFHLSELPGASTTRGKVQQDQTGTTTTTAEGEEEVTGDAFDDLLNSYIENQLMQQLIQQSTAKAQSPFEKFSQLLTMFPTGAMANPLTDQKQQQKAG